MTPSLGTDKPVARAVLVGGPADLPDAARERLVAGEQDKIKVEHRGGYEHFALDPDAADPLVYRWTTRTKVAE